MHEIICPHCGKAFKIDEAGYADIVKQVRDGEFEQQLHERLEVLLELAGPYHMAIMHHQQRKRALPPLRVGDAHHRYFAYRRVAADQVFEGQG